MKMSEIADEAAALALTERLRDLAAMIEPIQGWCDARAGCSLYRWARFDAPAATIVEIGSWKGRSTAWLASALKDRGEGCVFAVDTWLGSAEKAHRELLESYAPGQLRNEFLKNMELLGLGPYVRAVEEESVNAARQWARTLPIGLLLIDGAHDYASVRADFEFWSPLLAAGAIVVFDDVPAWPGPLQVATEMPGWYQRLGFSFNQVAFRRI